MLKKLSALNGIVLSTGGGSVLREENRCCLREHGTVVYLHALPEVLLERTRYDSSRPLVKTDAPLKKLREMNMVRDPIYRETAHIVIDAESCAKTLRKLVECLDGQKFIEYDD